MSKIIPAILAKTAEEFESKLKILEEQANEIQIDIMDGEFVPNTTFYDPKIISQFKTNLNFELHIMANDPAKIIDAWQAVPNVTQAIFHFEINKPLEPIIQKIKSLGWQVGIAINPETSTQEIMPFITQIDSMLVMGVNPGFSGQEFKESALDKILKLRENIPSIKIEVDGGVNETNIKEIAHAGADGLIVASAVFDSPNPIESLKKLNNKLINIK